MYGNKHHIQLNLINKKLIVYLHYMIYKERLKLSVWVEGGNILNIFVNNESTAIHFSNKQNVILC